MQKVSVRTLVLLIELLAFVLAYQVQNWTPPAQASVVWLAGQEDLNER